MRDDLPTGTVTFLFTDVEGSTRLLWEIGDHAYDLALAEHRSIVRSACAAHGGVEVDTQGDAFFFAFPSADEALAAAAEMTDALASARIRLRIGLHTGTPRLSAEGYVGKEVHLAARVAATGHGGQIVLSHATRALVDELPFTELGEHRLKDIEGAVSIYQLGDKTFPPLKTISNTNLPRPASSFVGRERELAEVLARFEQGARLLTLTGPGGSGKTRLAVEAAAALVPAYKAGVFWVGLASLREASLVTEQVAQVLGAKDGLAAYIGEREMLLLLDNLEQVIGAAPTLSGLVQMCPNLTLLCTSRELLRVQGEVDYPVPPLASAEAVDLFCERSGLEPSADIAELCARLDDLPLAVELAAARSKAISPARILERLSDRLDLLKGGRDAEARQQTLRTTIAWSYDLLSEEEQRAFRAVSIFSGGSTLEAAAEVTDADLDTLQSLVEKSLLRYTDDRYWMLETIREYASGRLDEAGETSEYAVRHARYYLTRLEENDPILIGPRQGELLAWSATEEDNLRALLDHVIAVSAPDAARAVHLLRSYWSQRGTWVEAQQRLREVLDLPELDDWSQATLLNDLANAEEDLDNLDAAEAAAVRATAVAEKSGITDLVVATLRIRAWIMARRGRDDGALKLIRRAADMAGSEDVDAFTRVHTKHDLGALLGEAGHSAEAREVFQQTMDEAPRLGYTYFALSSTVQIGFIDLFERRFEEARRHFASGLDQAREIGHYRTDIYARWGLGYATLGLGQRDEARAMFAEAFDLVFAAPQTVPTHFLLIASGVAHAASPDRISAATRLRGAINTSRETLGLHDDPRNIENERFFDRSLMDALGEKAWAKEQALGAAMTYDEMVELARSLVERSAAAPAAEQAPLD